MEYPHDLQPAERAPAGLTLLDFLVPEPPPATNEGGADALELFLRSLDEGRPTGGDAERADIDGAILADRLFPQERLPSVVVAAAPGVFIDGEKLPAMLRRDGADITLPAISGPHVMRILALAFVVSGVGLFSYAQGMRDRERRPAATQKAQKAERARSGGPAIVVDVVPTRFNDATTAAALAPVVAGSTSDAADGERVTHDPAVPVARILAVAERFVSEGDILAARAMLDDLVGREDPHGLFAMAETFDPNMLATWNLTRAEANVARARALYRQAMRLGQPEAGARLAALER